MEPAGQGHRAGAGARGSAVATGSRVVMERNGVARGAARLGWRHVARDEKRAHLQTAGLARHRGWAPSWATRREEGQRARATLREGRRWAGGEGGWSIWGKGFSLFI